jgi:hypothetical protein
MGAFQELQDGAEASAGTIATASNGGRLWCRDYTRRQKASLRFRMHISPPD